jgi:mitogen-activated protein kinase 15
MLETLKTVKQRNPKDWFSNAEDSVRDLMSKMLVFNPNKRINIDQILKHPYLEEFHDPPNEPICEHRIVPNISENRKLSMKEYRMLIYNEINRRNQGKRSASKDIDRCDIRC